MAEKLYVGRNNEISRVFYEETLGTKTAKNLTTATKIELKFYDDPEDVIVTFDDVANPTLFDKTGAASGIIVFKPIAGTFTAYESKLITDENKGVCHAQYVVYTAIQTAGVVFPEFEVEFEKI